MSKTKLISPNIDALSYIDRAYAQIFLAASIYNVSKYIG